METYTVRNVKTAASTFVNPSLLLFWDCLYIWYRSASTTVVEK